jgi:CRP-like cAMP-binding protein
VENIIAYFNQIGITETELQPFLSKLHAKSYPAGSFILSSGQTDHYLSFLNTGVIRYFVQTDNKEFTFDFVLPNSFFCHYDSFYSSKVTRFTSQAIIDCEIIRIHKDDLTELYETCKYAKDLSRIAVERLLERKVKRELSLLIDSPEQRYINLVAKKPELIQSIPQKYLAAYLGIVPETLSRIRKRIYLTQVNA